jgi:uncharacterized protein, YhcH/YjgK/YiaL family
MLYGDFDSVEMFKSHAALYEALVFWRDKAASLADGKYDLGKGMSAQIKGFAPQPREERRYETHAKYADIQCVLAGDETIYVRPPAGLEVQEYLVEERDVVFYEQPADGAAEMAFLMRPGLFLLLCPEDAHKPECFTTVPVGRKIVFKIPVSML